MISIDTLTLTTPDYKIKETDNFIFSNIPTDGETGEPTFKSPLIVNGKQYSKIYLKDDFRKKTGKLISGITINPAGMKIDMSVPRFNAGGKNNIFPVGYKDFVSVIDTLSGYVETCGVNVDIKGMKIYRLDTFRNLSLNNKIPDYFPALRLSKFQYANKTREIKTETYSSGNGERGVIFYDKEKDTLNKGEIFPPDLKNIMRGELKILKSRGVKKTFEIKTIGELIKNYNVIPENYLKVMEKTFPLRTKPSDFTNLFDYDGIFEKIRRETKRGAIDKFIMTIGLQYIPVPDFLDWLTLKGYSRKHIWKVEKDLNNLKGYLYLIAKNPAKHIVTLYSELREKLIAA